MKSITKDCIDWIRSYFEQTNGKTAVLGISGGKDSTVVAALCERALGKEKVVGVLLPNGVQTDLNDSISVCREVGIKQYYVNIGAAYQSILGFLPNPSENTKINLAPRLRMACIYAVAQSMDGGRVACTGNADEEYVGYSTLYGDLAGDFAPIIHFSVREVIEMGEDLGLPEYLLKKAPADGLTGKTDEEKMGFSYSQVEEVRKGNEVDDCLFKKIEDRHASNLFKQEIVRIPAFLPKEEA